MIMNSKQKNVLTIAVILFVFVLIKSFVGAIKIIGEFKQDQAVAYFLALLVDTLIGFLAYTFLSPIGLISVALLAFFYFKFSDKSTP